ncbi:carboxymuconolactone decarboxylase family protein [Streptomyces sp. C36]|uniref:carboxymuconolactone decarboxylase family protein n=1 Tax=Streptomyces sp. C36 TaxID=3237122 RepID=UPI0034C69C59
MPRMPYKDADALPESMRALSQGRIINVYRMLLHSQQTVEQIARLGSALFATGASLSAVDRELLILNFGLHYEAEYEWAQHVSISAAVGVTDEQRVALRQGDTDADVFTPAQRALLRFSGAVADGPTVKDDVHAAVREHYSEEQVVETLVLAGFYFLLGRVCTVLDVDIDASDGYEVVRQALRLQGQ